MVERRSYYLASRDNDFAEPTPDFAPACHTEIPFTLPANDNDRAALVLSMLRRALIRKVVAWLQQKRQIGRCHAGSHQQG
jgi:hypothetical protein